MNYKEFNKRVYAYYIENLIPREFNSLTIPNSDFDELIEDKINIQKFKEINTYDWSLLLRYDGSIPKYFGLLALQCYAAFYMQNDGRVTAANFRDRFIAITCIESTQKLNQFFSENYNQQTNVQEKIWLEAKRFLKEKSIFLDIPILKSYAGRYTQFPESQCVLNYEDLKEYRAFYNYIYSNYETIHYDGFVAEYKNYRNRLIPHLTRENNASILTENEEKIKRRQIFDFYNSLDWLEFNLVKSQKKSSPENYIAKRDGDRVMIYNEDFEVFENYIYLLDNKRLAVFRQDKVYTNEYVKCNHLELNTFFIIVTSSRENYFKLLKLGGKEINLHLAQSEFYGVMIQFINEIPLFLSSYQSQEFPVKIIGKKINSKRQYLISNLPRIEAADGISYRLYCDQKRIFDNQPNSIGKYIIKVNGYTSYSFEVVPNELIRDIICEPNYKLNLRILEFCKEGQMHGFGAKLPEVLPEKEFSINNWIQVLTTINIENPKLISRHFLINAINQYKNGKN